MVKCGVVCSVNVTPFQDTVRECQARALLGCRRRRLADGFSSLRDGAAAARAGASGRAAAAAMSGRRGRERAAEQG